VKPFRTGQDFVPLELPRPRLGNGAVRTIVDDLSRPLACALFEKINTDAITRTDDGGGIDPEAAQFVDGALREIIGRQARDVASVGAELREHHRHIGLCAAEGDFKVGRLREAQVAGGCEAKHDLAKSDDVGHWAGENA